MWPARLGLELVILTGLKWQNKIWWLKLFLPLDACPSLTHAAPEAEMADPLLHWLQNQCSLQPAYFGQLKLISGNINGLSEAWCRVRSIPISRSLVLTLRVTMRERLEIKLGKVRILQLQLLDCDLLLFSSPCLRCETRWKTALLNWCCVHWGQAR